MTMAMLVGATVVGMGVVALASVNLVAGPTPVRDLARTTMKIQEGTGAVANITKSTRRSITANAESGVTAAAVAAVQALAVADLDHVSEAVIKRIGRSDITKIVKRSKRGTTRRAKSTRRNPLVITGTPGRGIDTTISITMIRHRTKRAQQTGR